MSQVSEVFDDDQKVKEFFYNIYKSEEYLRWLTKKLNQKTTPLQDKKHLRREIEQVTSKLHARYRIFVAALSGAYFQANRQNAPNN